MTAMAPRRSKSRVVQLASIVPLLAVAGSALAEGGEHGGVSSDLVWQAINLVLLLLILFYVARKPVSSFFSGRRERITGDLAAAAEILSQAELRNSELQRRLVDLGSDVEEIHETTRRRAEEETERILAEARRTAERIRADAAAAIDQELLRAKRELRVEATDLALELSADILGEHVTDGDRERLLDEFITRVEPGPDSAGR